MNADPGHEPEQSAAAERPQGWAGRRIFAAIVCVLLCSLVVPAATMRMPMHGPLVAVVFGIVLSGVYAITGSVPQRLRGPWVRIGPYALGGVSINEPDDPSNLSYKIVIPVLVVVLAVAGVAILGLALKWW